VPGPQLVVPITNARYALNAANARWGSLYDCLYGTDAMGSLPPPAAMSGAAARGSWPGRGCFWTRRFRCGHQPCRCAALSCAGRALLVDDLPLVDPEKFAATGATRRRRMRSLLRNNGLHVELVFDRAHFIGARDQALLADVRLESALTAIMDCEDSVACVDAEDKVLAYANWLGLMRGDLTEDLPEGRATMTRRLAATGVTAPDGSPSRSRAAR
jgi:malate synthase